MSSALPPVPYQNAVTDKNGVVTPGWSNWFKQIYNRVGAATASTNLELAALFPVSTANIQASAVTSAKIAAGAVTSAAMAANSVATASIQNAAVTFAKLLSTDWSSSLAASGYQKLGSGLYIQWGVTGSIPTSTNTAITFPIAFPNACLQVITGIQANSAGVTTSTGHFGSGAYSTTGFTLYNRTSVAYVFNYLAVGY
jgi:hypothetical protein